MAWRDDGFLPQLKRMPGGYGGKAYWQWLRDHESKEALKRGEWLSKYEAEIRLALEQSRYKPADDLCAARAERDAIRRQMLADQACERRRHALRKVPTPPPPEPPPPQPSCCLPSGMKCPDPQDAKWLVFGLSWDGEGRAKYLKRRYEDLPWVRWCYPATVNTEYLWEPHCGASVQGPSFPLAGVLERDMYRRNQWMPSRRAPQPTACVPPPPRPPQL